MHTLSRLVQAPGVCRLPRSVAMCGALLALVACATDPPLSAPPPPLAAQETRAGDTLPGAGASLDRELAPGDEHQYRVTLARSEYVAIAISQRGIDVVGRTEDPDGRPLGEFEQELTPRGEERVELVADAPGTYGMTLTPAAGVVEAGGYTIRVLERRSSTDGDRAIQASRVLRLQAAGLELSGRFDESRPLFEQALQLAEGARGPDDPYVTALVGDLAGNALESRDDARAGALYQRALASMEKAGGTEQPEAAIARSRVALVYERAGQGPKAEALLKPAIASLERTLGPDHPWVARVLVTEASVRIDAGDLEQADVMERRALGIVEQARLTDTILYADILNNLGEIYRLRGDFAAAGDLFRRSMAIGERRRGPGSYYVSTSLQNLGIIAREMKGLRRRRGLLHARAGHPGADRRPRSSRTWRSC